MNWREFEALTNSMAEGRADANAAAINRAMTKRAQAETAACWLRFADTCSGHATNSTAPSRPAAPSSWLPPLP
ncbi:hypothetical protein ASD15_14240 [Massilia sp. Root351]|jgi:hypothetical protein|uniref:hypothetical protein n=1 Tax=Massilia sp. Root351 TaxID=1736522 RepID=UPI00070C179A|nr:hypothetical protein [Massilia sp. Root351]KQV81036.1 hypothetical protein ASD15_14240 [Massilia sp. Root351]